MPRIRIAQSAARDPDAAVAEVRAALEGACAGGVLVFVDDGLPPAALGPALAAAFPGPLAGCTAAGVVGEAGFARRGLLAIGFDGARARIRPLPLGPLDDAAACAARAKAALPALAPGWHRAGVLLIDGLSTREEAVAAALARALPGLDIVGGSAGDDLAFAGTAVLVDGGFAAGTGVLVVLESDAPVAVLRSHHFETGIRKLVCTRAEPERRLLLELDGAPAAGVYARSLGLAEADLGPAVFSRNPLEVREGARSRVVSIARVMPGGALALLGAIEEGESMSIARALDPRERLLATLASVRGAIGEPEAVLGLDCILRRVQFEDEGIAEEMGALYARHRICGFSTYGEQCHGAHMNQTLVGVAFGR